MADKIGNVQAIANIPAARLRDIFRRTMVLGLSSVAAERPTFHWAKQVSFAEHDSSENPWDWTAAPDLDVTPAPEQVLCAYEFSAPFGRTGAVPERVGEFNISTLMITMFEDEYEVVSGSGGSGFSYVTVGPNLDTRWFFRYVQPGVNLGGLSAFQINCAAEDT